MLPVKRRIEFLNKPKKKGNRLKFISGTKYQEESELYDTKSWDDYKEIMNAYNRNGKSYIRYSLIIQLFPLLGILGTVSGLFLALQNGELSGENLYSDVGFALSSTVLGIAMAIIFKFLDTFILSNIIVKIDGECELYEKSYKVLQNVYIQQNQDAEVDNEQGVKQHAE